MKAIWNEKVIAEAPREDLIYIEGNWYFPPASVNKEHLVESPTPYTCPWKGVCQYYNVVVGDKTARDGAFTYQEPMPTAIAIVKKDFSNYIAFWREVEVK